MDSEAKRFLGKLWADESPINRQTPEEVGIDRTEGWDINYEIPGTGKYPERTIFNQLLRELQGAFQEKLLYGCPRWVSDVDFPQYSYVNYNNGLYWASITTGPTTDNAQEPGNGSIWIRF